MVCHNSENRTTSKQNAIVPKPCQNDVNTTPNQLTIADTLLTGRKKHDAEPLLFNADITVAQGPRCLIIRRLHQLLLCLFAVLTISPHR